MYFGLHVKYSLVLFGFNKIGIFSTNFRKILNYRISWNTMQKGTRNAENEHNVPMAIRPFCVANRVNARSDNESNTILTSHELPHCTNKPVAGSLSTSEHTTEREGVHTDKVARPSKQE
jgi:hypothetical protein